MSICWQVRSGREPDHESKQFPPACRREESKQEPEDPGREVRMNANRQAIFDHAMGRKKPDTKAAASKDAPPIKRKPTTMRATALRRNVVRL